MRSRCRHNSLHNIGNVCTHKHEINKLHPEQNSSLPSRQFPEGLLRFSLDNISTDSILDQQLGRLR